MINPDIIANTDAIREDFVSAKPFRHVVMENFFTAGEVAALYEQFPRFEDKNALNEFGAVGGKAVVTDIKKVSPAYEALYAYLNSKPFLDLMSQLTGIPDLLPDPALYGGGTHENVEGQELDPHVDYNYISGGKLHRRLNLLVYLNKEWEDSWGGSIELHSNPRRAEEDQITGFLPLYNRALVFETNEHSWHGFRKIQLPADKKHLTRKSIAIYLYTASRPQDEVAPAHSTFYVQRHLPDYIKPGHTLDENSYREILILLRRRDDWLEAYQKKELHDSRHIADLQWQLAQAWARVSEVTSGYPALTPAPAVTTEGPPVPVSRPPLTAARLVRMIYYRFPLPWSVKLALKSFVFTCFGFLFKNRLAYKNWQAHKQQSGGSGKS